MIPRVAELRVLGGIPGQRRHRHRLPVVARAALSQFVPLASRPKCLFGAEEFNPCGDADPGIEQSSGWVWALAPNATCYWSDTAASGAGHCDGTAAAATKGRVWIR